MVYSMLTSGASWSRVEPSLDIETGRIKLIDEIFCQYDVDTLLNTDPMILVDKVKAQTLGTQYIKNQMVSIFADYRYYPNQLIFNKVRKAMESEDII